MGEPITNMVINIVVAAVILIAGIWLSKLARKYITIAEEGIQIPYPQRDVHLYQLA